MRFGAAVSGRSAIPVTGGAAAICLDQRVRSLPARWAGLGALACIPAAKPAQPVGIALDGVTIASQVPMSVIAQNRHS